MPLYIFNIVCPIPSPDSPVVETGKYSVGTMFVILSAGAWNVFPESKYVVVAEAFTVQLSALDC